MKRFSIFTMIYNDYELLRQFVESILNNVNPDTWEHIVIVDDYSELNTRLREYEEYLKKDSRFKIINFPEHRRMADYMKPKEGWKFNLGHGRGFNKCIEGIETEFALYFDVDCVFLKKSWDMLKDLCIIFDSDHKIMGVGQLFGTNDHSIYDQRFTFFHGPAGRDSTTGGFLGPSGGSFRMSQWTEKKTNLLSEGRLPNLLSGYSEGVFEKGFKIASYPWFTEMEVLHLGRGIVRKYSESERGMPDTDWFVFCKDFRGRHGPRFDDRDIRSNHYGRGFINITSKEYRNYLKLMYQTPFDQIQPSIPEDWVYTVD